MYLCFVHRPLLANQQTCMQAMHQVHVLFFFSRAAEITMCPNAGSSRGATQGTLPI